MEIYRNVYIDDSINKSGINKSIKKIKKNKPDINLYLVCTMQKMGCVMEIFHYSECLKPHNKTKKYLVIGIAPDKNAAISIAVKIIQSCVLNNIMLTSNGIYNYFSSLQNKN